MAEGGWYVRMQMTDWGDNCYLIVVQIPAELVSAELMSAELRLGKNCCR